MKHFFQRIQEKSRDVGQAPVLIVALGDSVTQGVMEQHRLDGEGVYHSVLQRKLQIFFPTTSFSTINAGVSGDNAPQALKRLQRDVLWHDPDLVMIGFGLNDAGQGLDGLAKFTEALREMIERIQKETAADILLLTPSFAARRDSVRIHPDHQHMAEGIFRTQNEGILSEYAEAIRTLGRKLKVVVADIHQEWVRLAEDGLDTDLWLINGLNHPDKQGHQLAAEVVFNSVFSQRF